MARFAIGARAWAMCDICACRCRYRDLRGTTVMGRPTGLLVCPRCWDPDHPQNFLPQAVAAAGADAQALEHPRPDTGLEASRRMYPNANWPPFPSTAATRDQPTQFRDPGENATGSNGRSSS